MASTISAGASERSEAGQRYSAVAIILHWVIAAAILFQMVGGKWMVSRGDSADQTVFAVFQIHKTVGLTILALTLARIIWRLTNPAPALPAGMKGWEIAAAKFTHIGFYALLLAVPLTGWAMASVSPTGVPTLFLLLDALPFAHLPYGDLSLEARHDWEVVLKNAHNYLSIATGVLVALHIAAALKHQFVAKDNLIARMILSARTVPVVQPKTAMAVVALGVAALFVCAGIAGGLAQRAAPGVASTAALETTTPASAGAWVIDHEASALGFTITFTGNAVEGTVGSWTGDVIFDPQALDQARATITVDAASIGISNSMLAPQSGGSDGFDVANHPTITYEASDFAAQPDGSFIANGTLTLRGATADAPLAFTFEEIDGVASVSGSTQLNRLDFGIGAIGAADESWLQHAVTVTFDLTASRP
ncbi:MAG: cytochrome b/b6 domain-containing protein [Devosiaceae bacterium]|nr:cytochrome b/b6 domain-containing protein [Devosiaceae bacterium MH13]